MMSLKDFKEFEIDKINVLKGGVKEKTTYTTVGSDKTGTDTRECCDGLYWYEFDDATAGWGKTSC